MNMFNEGMIEDFRNYLLLERNSSLNTVDGYIRDLEQFDNFLKGKDFREVENNDVSMFVRELSSKGLKPQTTNRKLSSIKSFYLFLRRNGHVNVSPAEVIQGAKQEMKLPQPIDIEDINDIFDAIPEEDLRAKVIFEILYGTGARRFEVAKIRVRDINFKRKYIKILGKGNKERLVPINEHALVLIQKLINQNENKEWLFPSTQNEGKCISIRLVSLIVKTYVNKAGLEDFNITPHKFRHSFCSHLYAGGADLKTIQTFAGHASSNTTNGYTKISNERSFNEYSKAHPRANMQA